MNEVTVRAAQEALPQNASGDPSGALTALPISNSPYAGAPLTITSSFLRSIMTPPLAPVSPSYAPSPPAVKVESKNVADMDLPHMHPLVFSETTAPISRPSVTPPSTSFVPFSPSVAPPPQLLAPMQKKAPAVPLPTAKGLNRPVAAQPQPHSQQPQAAAQAPQRTGYIKKDFQCEACGATSTPERRRGPSGRNTLCNRCGIQWARLKKREQDRTKQRETAQTLGSVGTVGGTAGINTASGYRLPLTAFKPGAELTTMDPSLYTGQPVFYYSPVPVPAHSLPPAMVPISMPPLLGPFASRDPFSGPPLTSHLQLSSAFSMPVPQSYHNSLASLAAAAASFSPPRAAPAPPPPTTTTHSDMPLQSSPTLSSFFMTHIDGPPSLEQPIVDTKPTNTRAE